MSRSVKDLRELICISRLSVRSSGSDQESDESGQDYDESYDRHTDPASQQHGGQATLPKELTGYSNEILSAITRKTSEKKNVVASMKSPRSARSSSSREIVVGRPKSAVGGVRRPPSSLDCELHSTSSTKGFDKFGSMNLNRKNFYEAANCRKKPDEVEVSRAKKMENMLQYIDATVVCSLLENCNVQLKEISMWLRTEQNFVSLANFLMTKFHYKKRKELFEMETSFILDELHVAFGVGIRDKKVKTVDLKDLLNVILREYPSKMLGRKGLIWFVQTIETFCCGKDESFRQLLSDVSLSTQNKQHIQWLLGMRAFSLVSLANGVIYFYKNLCQLEAKREEGTAMKTLSSISDLKQVWLDAALEHDYLEVLEYLLQSLDKSQEIMDKIIFKSAIYGSERILTDFMQKASKDIDLDRISETGSTALHIAVNNEKTKVVELLLKNGASVNTPNSAVDDATPLHMAVITGNECIVKLLIANGADKSAQMGNSPPITPVELAKELGHSSLLQHLA